MSKKTEGVGWDLYSRPTVHQSSVLTSLTTTTLPGYHHLLGLFLLNSSSGIGVFWQFIYQLLTAVCLAMN